MEDVVFSRPNPSVSRKIEPKRQIESLAEVVRSEISTGHPPDQQVFSLSPEEVSVLSFTIILMSVKGCLMAQARIHPPYWTRRRAGVVREMVDILAIASERMVYAVRETLPPRASCPSRLVIALTK